MIISHEDFDKDIFDHNESNTLEYKALFRENMILKYIETICGFLNSGGGKLIFGITDNLLSVGLNFDSKKIDNCILLIDDITRNQKIIGTNNLTNNIVNLAPTCIKPYVLTNTHGRKYIIVDVIPEINVLYQLTNGKCYYRLGASNYLNRCQTYYTESELSDRCNKYKNVLQEENKHNIDTFTNIINIKDKEISRLQIQNELLMHNNKEINAIYDNYIKNAIKYIKSQQIPAYDYFMQYLSNCFPQEVPLRELCSRAAFPPN